MRYQPFRLTPEAVGRVREWLREEDEAGGDNIIVPAGEPTANAQNQDEDQHTIRSAPSTRVPETPNIPATAPPPQRHHKRNQASRRTSVDDTQHLRIRNALQREEVRSVRAEMRRIVQDMGRMEGEAADSREQILHYRNELRSTRIWMEVGVFSAALLFLCVLLYIAWCWVNSVEFEFQEKIMRRNLGLD